MADFDDREGENGAQAFNSRWWLPDDGETLARDLVSTYTHLEQVDRPRQAKILRHLRLYGNQAVEGVNPSTYNRILGEDRLTLNVVANYCDLATARIGKQRPAPKPLPSGGNYSLRRKSKLLERFLQAQFRISKVYRATRRQFLDATVFGTGIVKPYVQHDQIKVERIFPSEVLVDPLEGLYGEPRMFIQRKWVSKAVLREIFAGKMGGKGIEATRLQRAINDAEAEIDSEDPWNLTRDTVGDQVLVLEAWHLPSGPKAKDGRHAMVTSAGPLLVEAWEHDYAPLLFFRWKEPLRGFWGVGLADELAPIQVEINRILIRIQKSMRRLGAPLIMLDARSKVAKNAFTNELGSFLHYMGTKPEVVTFQTTHPETFQQLDRLWQRAGDISGFSQESAAPTTHSISGISAQTQHEIGTERFAPQAQDYEQLHLDLAFQLIDRAEEIAKRNSGKYALPAKRDRNTISMIDWSEIDMKADQYVLDVLPVSSFPQLPGPRQDRVIAMLESGMIDPQTANELLDFPDLDRHMSLARAASDAIDRAVENMLDEGIQEVPEPFTDLNLALKKVQAAYNKAQNDGVEEEGLERLRVYMTHVARLLQKAQVEQMKLAAANAAQNQPAPPAAGAPPAPGPTGQPPGAVNPMDGVA